LAKSCPRRASIGRVAGNRTANPIGARASDELTARVQFGTLALQPLLPLHSCLAEQELASLLAPLQDALALQEVLALQPVLSALLSAAACAGGAPAAGASGAGALPPHAERAPTIKPADAAETIDFVKLKAIFHTS
jgi:hypothetical protein